jgi:hypothetical protein
MRPSRDEVCPSLQILGLEPSVLGDAASIFGPISTLS